MSDRTEELRDAVIEAAVEVLDDPHWMEAGLKRLADRQEAQWNVAGTPGNFPQEARLPVLVEEVGEVAEAMQYANPATTAEHMQARAAHLRAEVMQVAAVAVRWIEALDAEAGR